MANFKFVQNKKCEYFPCHTIADESKFNCLFCYCPLYMLGEKCGGNFKYTHGVKDCSACIIPHIKDSGYDFIQQKMLTVIDVVQNEYLEKHKDEEKINIK